MALQIYLSGEIHTDWRDEIIAGAKAWMSNSQPL